jgi:polysaccharide pyruvyl transferase WcaK-like protein
MLHKVPWNVLAAIPALIVNRPIVLLSQTLGPFNRWLNRVAARWVLSRVILIHGRGQRSTDYVRYLGIKTVRYWPDLSFGMDLSAAKRAPDLQKWSTVLDRHSEGGRHRMVGLTPNTIVAEKMGRDGISYAALIAQSIQEFDARGYRAVLIPHSYRIGTEQAHNNDLHICREIINLLPPEVKCRFIDDDLSSQTLRLLIGRFDFLLASRFHSMVSALAMGVPPLTIGWGGHKYLEVLEEFGVQELYIDFSGVSLKAICERLNWLESHKEEVRRRIAVGRDTCMQLAEGLGEELIRLSKQARPHTVSIRAASEL